MALRSAVLARLLGLRLVWELGAALVELEEVPSTGGGKARVWTGETGVQGPFEPSVDGELASAGDEGMVMGRAMISGRRRIGVV